MTNNPTPKEAFLADAAQAKRHADLVARPELRRALEVALLEHQRRATNALASAPDPAAAAWRLAGAQEFVAIFLGLADLTAPAPRRDPDNLLPQ